MLETGGAAMRWPIWIAAGLGAVLGAGWLGLRVQPALSAPATSGWARKAAGGAHTHARARPGPRASMQVPGHHVDGRVARL
jgi:hypothetical protein